MIESIIVPTAAIFGIIVLLLGTIMLAITSVMLLTILFAIGFGGPIVLTQELMERI